MLRVLHCIYDDPKNPWVGGGGALRVWEIYRRLKEEVQVTVASGAFPGSVDEEVGGVRYLRLGAQKPYALSRLSYALAASRLLAEGDYDVGLFDFSVYTPIRLPPQGPVGLIVHMLHGPTARERWGRAGGGMVATAERRAIQSARWICSTSHWMADQLRVLARPDARISLVGSGVPPEFFEVSRAESDYLLYYGRFDLFHKGLDTVLEAFARLSPRHPGVRLRIAGRGKDTAAIRQLAQELGVESRVELLEGVTRREVLQLFSGALAMLMPSRLEGLPMAPAEAMAAGVPVIAASVGALPELLESPDVGTLVPPDDPAALADAAEALLLDAVRRRQVSDAARRSAERFSWDRVARQHLEFLKTVAAQRGRTSNASDGTE